MVFRLYSLLATVSHIENIGTPLIFITGKERVISCQYIYFLNISVDIFLITLHNTREDVVDPVLSNNPSRFQALRSNNIRHYPYSEP